MHQQYLFLACGQGNNQKKKKVRPKNNNWVKCDGCMSSLSARPPLSLSRSLSLSLASSSTHSHSVCGLWVWPDWSAANDSWQIDIQPQCIYNMMSDHGATVAAAATTTTTAATAFKCKQLCNTDAVSGCNQQQQQQHQQYEYSSATYTWSSSSSPVTPVPAANWRACIRQTPLDIQAAARVSIDMPEGRQERGRGVCYCCSADNSLVEQLSWHWHCQLYCQLILFTWWKT